MANIVIIEENLTIREGLKTLFNSNTRHRCIGTYSHCDIFFEKNEANEADVVLIDINNNDSESIKKFNGLSRKPYIIALSLYGENENLFKALCSGAQGYILKKTPPDQFLNIIDEILEKRARMSAAIANKIINRSQNRKLSASHGLSKNLTDDEFNILSFMRQGNSASAVAENMHITVNQIQKHFFNIYGKLKTDESH